jgi:hypothetical protein
MRWVSAEERLPALGRLVEVELEPDPPIGPRRGGYIMAFRSGASWYDIGHKLVTRPVLRWLEIVDWV